MKKKWRGKKDMSLNKGVVRKMKYIRTQDGRIIKIFDGDIDNEICGIKFDTMGFRLQITMQFNCIVKEDIVKIADTIEELCDEFVVIIENKPHIIPREWLKQDIIVDELYGAIWTEKGLIYVAKMNDKGELELL